MPLKYIGHCKTCGVALYQDGDQILAQSKSNCNHVLANTKPKLLRWNIRVWPEEQEHVKRRARRTRVSQMAYIRALIQADKRLCENMKAEDICPMCFGRGRVAVKEAKVQTGPRKPDPYKVRKGMVK